MELALKQLQRKPRKNLEASWTHDFRDTGAMLYQLSREALLEAGQEQVQGYCRKDIVY